MSSNSIKTRIAFMTALHGEIDFTKWFFFGERNDGIQPMVD